MRERDTTSTSQAPADPFKAEAARQAAEVQEEQKKVPTLETLHADEKTAKNFGKLFESAAAAAEAAGDDVQKAEILQLGERFALNKPASGDYEKLAIYREQYGERMKEVEQLRDELTEEQFNQIVASSPKLMAFANAKKDWKVVRGFILAEMENVAFGDKIRFDDIVKKIKDNNRYEQSEAYKGNIRTVSEICNRYGVSTERLTEISRIKDPNPIEDPNVTKAMQRDALRDLVREKTTGIGRFLTGRWTKSRVNELESNTKTLAAEIQDIKKFQKELGDTLALTIDESPEMLDAFAKLGTPEAAKMEKEMPMSPKESGAVLSELRNEETLKAAWKADQGSADKSANPDAFAEKYVNDRLTKGGTKKKGFWASIAETLTKEFIKAKAALLT